MANRTQLGLRNQEMRERAKQRTERCEKRKLAKEKALTDVNKPLRVRLGLTKH